MGPLAVRTERARRLFAVSMAGLLLSVCIELAQFYDSGRVTNMSDVYLNTLGAMLGAVAADLLGEPEGRSSLTLIAAHPIPVMLLVALLGYHLFPYVPTIDEHKYWQSLRPLMLYHSLSFQSVLRYTALWVTASWLVGAILGYARSRTVVPLFIGAVFACKILIETLVLSLPEVLGGVTAVGLWLAIGSSDKWAALLISAVLCGTIVVGRLEPFQFEPTARAFGWLPFSSFLNGSLEVNTIAFLEKFFLYGSLVWIAATAGLRLWLATVLVALVMFITSVVELYLPGRSAEITDAIMTLIIGLIMAPMRPQLSLNSAHGCHGTNTSS